MKKNDLINEIVDIEKMLEHTMVTNRCNTPNDFVEMHMVSRGIYYIS